MWFGLDLFGYSSFVFAVRPAWFVRAEIVLRLFSIFPSILFSVVGADLFGAVGVFNFVVGFVWALFAGGRDCGMDWWTPLLCVAWGPLFSGWWCGDVGRRILMCVA
jgi:hypothetical protein